MVHTKYRNGPEKPKLNLERSFWEGLKKPGPRLKDLPRISKKAHVATCSRPYLSVLDDNKKRWIIAVC